MRCTLYYKKESGGTFAVPSIRVGCGIRNLGVVLGTILVALYTANLAAFMTTSRFMKDPQTLEDLSGEVTESVRRGCRR